MARGRIGIMGGSFNPIHCRHLQIAACALEEMQLDRVLFLPNGNPPHKPAIGEMESAAHRYEMTRLAVMPYDNFAISDLEMTRRGVMYTADTLKLLHKQYPDTDFFYIIGEDTLYELEHWYRPPEVFSQCSFAVAMRQNQNLFGNPMVRELRAKGAVLHFLTIHPMDISSSDIRSRIAQGEFDDLLLPPEVCEYIRIMQLYGSAQSPDGAREAYGKLKEALCEERMLHTMAVAFTANRLAKLHQLDAKACELAALLHDCAKCMSLGDMQQIAREANLKLSDIEFRSAALLHGPVGAVVARTKYGIEDQRILIAIAAHTTGFAGMTAFDMVVFLADKIEPYRDDIPTLAEIRALAQQDLYQATYAMLLNSQEYVTRKNRPLHPETAETIQWVLDHIH